MAEIHVYPDNRLVFENQTYRCALGRAGVIAATDKREGDGATPAGDYPIRAIWYRRDRVTLPSVKFPVHQITSADGWCDDPAHPEYNRHVKLPFAASHETLERADEIYDIVVVLGHNDDPPIPGMGSCIFWHIARPGDTPTQGCVAVALADMLGILPRLALGARVKIHSVPKD